MRLAHKDSQTPHLLRPYQPYLSIWSKKAQEVVENKIKMDKS